MDTHVLIKWRAYAAKNLFKCLIRLQKSFLIFVPHDCQYSVSTDEKKKSGKKMPLKYYHRKFNEVIKGHCH